MSFNNNDHTDHGNNIANQIQDEDAYGIKGDLTASDLWNILDQFETHLIDTPTLSERKALESLVTAWKRELEAVFPDMETV